MRFTLTKAVTEDRWEVSDNTTRAEAGRIDAALAYWKSTTRPALLDTYETDYKNKITMYNLARQATDASCAKVHSEVAGALSDPQYQAYVNDCKAKRADEKTALEAKERAMLKYNTQLGTSVTNFTAYIRSLSYSPVGTTILATMVDIYELHSNAQRRLRDVHRIHDAVSPMPNTADAAKYADFLDKAGKFTNESNALDVLTAALPGNCTVQYGGWLQSKMAKKVLDNGIDLTITQALRNASDGKWYFERSQGLKDLDAVIAAQTVAECTSAIDKILQKTEMTNYYLEQLILNDAKYLKTLVSGSSADRVQTVIDKITGEGDRQQVTFDYFNDMTASITKDGLVNIDMSRKAYNAHMSLSKSGFDDAFQYTYLSATSGQCPNPSCPSGQCDAATSVSKPACDAVFTKTSLPSAGSTVSQQLTQQMQSWYDSYDPTTTHRARCTSGCSDPSQAWTDAVYDSQQTAVGTSMINSSFTGYISAIAGQCGKHSTDVQGNDVFELTATSVNVFRMHTSSILLPDVFSQCTSRRIKYIVDALYDVDIVYTIPGHETVQVGIGGKLEWKPDGSGKYQLHVPMVMYSICTDGQACTAPLDVNGARNIDVVHAAGVAAKDYVWSDQKPSGRASSATAVSLVVDGSQEWMHKTEFTIVSNAVTLNAANGCAVPSEVVNLDIPICRGDGKGACNSLALTAPQSLHVSLNIKFRECPLAVVSTVEGKYDLKDELKLYAISIPVPAYPFSSGLQRNVLEAATFDKTKTSEPFIANGELMYSNASSSSSSAAKLHVSADDWVYMYATIPGYGAEKHSVRIVNMSCTNQLTHSRKVELFNDGVATSVLPLASKHNMECKSSSPKGTQGASELCSWIVPNHPGWSQPSDGRDYDVVSFPASRIRGSTDPVLWTGHYDCKVNVQMIYDKPAPNRRLLRASNGRMLYYTQNQVVRQVDLHPRGYHLQSTAMHAEPDAAVLRATHREPSLQTAATNSDYKVLHPGKVCWETPQIAIGTYPTVEKCLEAIWAYKKTHPELAKYKVFEYGAQWCHIQKTEKNKACKQDKVDTYAHWNVYLDLSRYPMEYINQTVPGKFKSIQPGHYCTDKSEEYFFATEYDQASPQECYNAIQTFMLSHPNYRAFRIFSWTTTGVCTLEYTANATTCKKMEPYSNGGVFLMDAYNAASAALAPVGSVGPDLKVPEDADFRRVSLPRFGPCEAEAVAGAKRNPQNVTTVSECFDWAKARTDVYTGVFAYDAAQQQCSVVPASSVCSVDGMLGRAQTFAQVPRSATAWITVGLVAAFAVSAMATK